MLEEQVTLLNREAGIKKISEIQRYAVLKMYYMPITQGNTYVITQSKIVNYHESTVFSQADSYRNVWIKEWTLQNSSRLMSRGICR